MSAKEGAHFDPVDGGAEDDLDDVQNQQREADLLVFGRFEARHAEIRRQLVS